MGVQAPGGGDEGQAEGDGRAKEEQRVKHGEHYQKVTKRSLTNLERFKFMS